MKIYNRYILILASVLLATTVIMAAAGEVHLDIYFSIYLIEVLALTELYVYLNPKAKRGLKAVNYVLFAGFLFIVAVEIIKIIWGIKIL